MTTAPRRWAVVWAVALPLAMLSVDFAGAGVALPSIGEDLDVSATSLTWVLNAFALGAAAPLVAAGRVADRVGRRTVLLSGLGIFCAATITCAVAPSFSVLIVGRVAQGVGTALFMAPSLGVLVAAFDEPFRTRAIGVWSAAGGAALAGGPIVAGVLTELASWRWFFAVNVPVLVAAAVLLVRFVDESRDHEARPIDPVGAVAATAGLAAGLFAVQTAVAHGIDHVGTLAAAAGAIVSIAVLVGRRRGGRAPLVAASLWRSTRYGIPTTVSFVANLGFGAANLLLTLYLQDIRGWNALETGLAFLVYSVPFAVIGIVIGEITKRLGLRVPLVAGMVLVVASLVAFAAIDGLDGPTMALIGLALAGIGQGLSFNLTTTASMNAVDPTSAGTASGVLATVRNLGIVAGVTVATAVAEAVGGDLPGTVTPGDPVAAEVASDFTDGLAAACWVVAGVSVIGVALATAVRTRD